MKRWVYVLIALLAVLPLLGLALASALAEKPQNLGVHDGRLADCPPSPNCVSSQASDTGHRMEPLPFEGSPDAALRRIQSAAAAVPRMELAAGQGNYLHYEATSLVFRFVDDVEFHVNETAKVIHFRSASRVGHSDFDANRERMQRIRQALQ